MKIIYGSGNKGKIEQMKRIVDVYNINAEILSIKDIGFDKDIVEDGETFEENSKIKASAIREYCNENNYNDYIILTDDAGICVDKLGGKPGVYSARWAGDHAPQEVVLAKLLDEMKEYTTNEERSCNFTCVLTASLPNGEYLVAKGVLEGHLALILGKPCKLTYEPIFVPEGFDKPMSDMSDEEFQKVKNHRSMAMINMFEKLKELGY